MKILVVEDDLSISKPIVEDLEHSHMVVSSVSDGETAWQMCLSENYDLILLDWMLPKLSGIELCRRLRDTGYAGSILMLTARGEKEDRIHGLDNGADDYLVKPFDIDELEARVRALLRRGTATTSELRLGKLCVDTRACRVRYQDTLIDLTPTEYRLVMNFLRNPDLIFSKHDLIDRLWTYEDPPSYAVIKTHIKAIRQKLLAAGCKLDLITTVYGFGYKLNVDFQ